MQEHSLWQSTIKLFIVGMLYFIVTAFFVNERSPELFLYKISFLLLTSLALALLLTRFKKSSSHFIGWFYIGEVLLILTSVALNHEFYVQNFERFQPYLPVKLLALFVALSAPTVHWVGWTSLSATAAVPLIQYYSWPSVFSAQLGIQEPAMTLSFIIVAATLYVNRLHTLKLMEKQIATSEKIAIFQRLGNLLAGLQHLNNTPLQTIEISLQLLRAKSPESKSLIDAMERAYHSVLRVNQLLSVGGSYDSEKSASTIEEFEEDIKEIGEYLKT